jgi:hypothetical protein
MIKRTLRALFGVGTLLALVATPAHAQIKWSVGAGLSLPSGDLKNGVNSGFHGMVAGDLAIPGAPIGIRADGVYNTFNAKASGNSSYNIITISLDATYRFVPGPVSPYLVAGPTMASASYNSVNSSSFGFNLGGGVNFGLGALKLFAETRYISTSKDGVSNHWIPVTIGIHF